MVFVLRSFFFFQSEDGIRDKLLTGVQTCALPIYRSAGQLPGSRAAARVPGTGLPGYAPRVGRSEERRVGKSVDLGGRRIIKKKKKKSTTKKETKKTKTKTRKKNNNT